MEPITIVKHNNPKPVDTMGDILFPNNSKDWYSGISKEDFENRPFICLPVISLNPWMALNKLGINCKLFKNKVKYECIYIKGNKYYWFLPLVIFTDNISFWIDRGNIAEWTAGSILNLSKQDRDAVICDKDDNRTDDCSRLILNDIEKVMLGYGYTDGTRPDDGYGCLKDASACLSNGDLIGGKVWVWYNK